MSKSNPTAAEVKIEELLKESWAKVEEAMKVADENGLEFTYEPQQIGTYSGKGSRGYYGDEGDELEEGEWTPSDWSSSSIYC